MIKKIRWFFTFSIFILLSKGPMNPFGWQAHQNINEKAVDFYLFR